MKNKRIDGCGKQCLVEGLDCYLQCGEMDGKNQFLCHECNKEYFILSKKIATTNFSTITNFIRVKDVKEFIKKLKEEIYEDDLLGWRNKRVLIHYSKMIDKLAGKKLT